MHENCGLSNYTNDNLSLVQTMKKPKIKNKKSSRRQINIDYEPDINYWTKRFGCSPEQLIKAVNKAGTSPLRVIRELAK